MGMKGLGATVIAGLALLLTAACAPNEANGESSAPSPVQQDSAAPSTIVLTGSGGRDAVIKGRLTMVGNCAGIGESVAVWPENTRVISDSPLALQVPGLGKVRAGDLVVGGGGLFDAATDGVDIVIPSSCGTTQGVTFRVE